MRRFQVALLTLLGGILGGAIVNVAWLERPHDLTNHAWSPFPAAMAVPDPLIGGGGLITQATSYGACTDSGGGLCITNTGWALADPITVSTLSFGVAAGTTTTFSNTTTSTSGIAGFTITCSTCTGAPAISASFNPGISVNGGTSTFGSRVNFSAASSPALALTGTGNLTMTAGANLVQSAAVAGGSQLLIGASAAALASNVAELVLDGASASGNNNIFLGTTTLATNGGQGDIVAAPSAATNGNSDLLLGTTTAPATAGGHIVLAGHVSSTQGGGTDLGCTGGTANLPTGCGNAGVCTLSSNACTVTFAENWTSATSYICTVSDTSTTVAAADWNSASSTSSQAVFKGSAASDVVAWHCYGVNGG